MTLILCIYSILAIVWAALRWFDSLLQIPFALLILTGFIFAISFAVRAFKRKGKWRERLILFMPLAIVALCGALLFLPLTDWKVKVDHCFLIGQRLKAIEDIPMNTQALSEVKLPHWWLSQDGTAYVFNFFCIVFLYLSDDETVIFFPVVFIILLARGQLFRENEVNGIPSPLEINK